MVSISTSSIFKKQFKKLNRLNQSRSTKLVIKLKSNPLLGKPMRYARKGTREVYLKPYRLAYMYSISEGHIHLLAIYHKDEQ